MTSLEIPWELTPHFKPAEFGCRCDRCDGRRLVTSLHRGRLQIVRYLAEVPMVISSGFRCEFHPLEIERAERGEKRSTHGLGTATDVVPLNSMQRHRILWGVYAGGLLVQRWGLYYVLEKIAEKGRVDFDVAPHGGSPIFDRVGIYSERGHLHLDSDTTRDQGVCWVSA